jgi:hypothetical protein
LLTGGPWRKLLIADIAPDFSKKKRSADRDVDHPAIIDDMGRDHQGSLGAGRSVAGDRGAAARLVDRANQLP